MAHHGFDVHRLTYRLRRVARRSIWASLDMLKTLDPEVRSMIFRSISSLPGLWGSVQLHRMEAVLTHAVRHVKYWREVAGSVGFHPDHMSDLSDIEKLPLTSRALVKKFGLRDLKAGNVPEERIRAAHTSGSTGEPLMFFQDTNELVERRLNILYGLGLHNTKMIKPGVISGLDTHTYLDPLGYRFSALESRGERISVLYPLLEQVSPVVLFCTPSYLEMFHYWLQRDGKSFSFKMIYCLGESITGAQRSRLAFAFHSEITSFYGTREIGQIAVECKIGRYHLLPWSNYIEVVDPTGASVQVGEEGEIVATSFHNFVMPFIRYRTGDRGRLLPPDCSCRTFTPVLQLVGRKPVVVQTENGKTFSVSQLSTAIASQFSASIIRFQLIQTKQDSFSFRFVPHFSYTVTVDRRLLGLLREIIGSRVDITLEKVEAILPDASGKTPVFIQDPQTSSTVMRYAPHPEVFSSHRNV